MKFKIAILLAGIYSISFADNSASKPVASYNNSGGVHSMYGTNPQMSNVNESPNTIAKLGFTPGWYAHKQDVTYIKLIGVGKQDMGLSVLFSTRGMDCPINQYLLFKKASKPKNTYNYTVGNGCVATITTNPTQKNFVMTVNSRSKCFEEYTYKEFCNGNLDVKYMDEQTSRDFIGVPFNYAPDQNDSDYDYNDD